MKKVGTLIAAVALCWAAAVSYSSMQDGTPDDRMGLSKTSVFDDPAPPAANPNASDPGDNELRVRPNLVGPPVIPHAVADYVPITREDNLCLECHAK